MPNKLHKIGFKKALIGFTVILGIALLNVFVSYYIVKRSETSITQMMQIVNPYLESLEKFNRLVTESKMYTTNWVYLQVDDEEKEKLKALQQEQYPAIKKTIEGQLNNISDRNAQRSLDSIFGDFDQLITVNRKIMMSLASFDDYNKPGNKLLAEDILESDVFVRVANIQKKLSDIISVNREKAEKLKQESEASLEVLVKTIFYSSFGLLVVLFLAAIYISKVITKPIIKMKDSITLLSKGELPSGHRIIAADVLGEIDDALNGLISNFSRTLNFASEISKGNLNAEYIPLSEKDEVGNALLSMRNSLKEYSSRMEYEVDERTKKLQQYSKALEVNEKKNRDLINYSQALICTHDLAGVLLSVNPALCMSLGYSEQEMVGKNIKEFVAPEYKARFKEYVDSINASEKSDGIMCVQSRTGEKKFFLYKNYKLTEDVEKPYVIGFSQDITRRVMAENELKKAKIIAEESSKTKELFLANMSHEIRTPMNGIIGMCTLLGKTQMDEDQKHYLKLIKNSSDNLLVIINDILDISKINSGKVTIENTAFNLLETVKAAVQPFIFRAKEKGISFVIGDIDPHSSMLTGDSHKLTQVLINLLNNAFKFTHRGMVELGCQLVNQTEEEATLEFSIKDTGIGIPQNKLDAIFENFTQANSDTTRKYGGTGLGLSICKKLIEIQGGRIWVESKENAGSIFKFSISYKKQMLANIIQENNLAVNFGSLGHLKILLAEDNEIGAEYAATLMKQWGFTVDVVGSGQQAVIFSRKNDYDVILMDIQMPDMNGIDATKLIRSTYDQLKAAVPIIALTANAYSEDHQNYIAAGMNGCISKPFEEYRLFEAISKCVKGHAKFITVNEAPGDKEIVTSKKTKLYDATGLKKVSAGDVHFERKMIGLFIKSSYEAMEEIWASAKNNNWDQVRFIAHKIKPNIDRMHINSLKETVRIIEKYPVEMSNTDELIELLVKFTSTLNDTVKQVEADFNIAA